MKSKRMKKKKPRYIVSHEYKGQTTMRSAFEQLVAAGVHEQINSDPPPMDSG